MKASNIARRFNYSVSHEIETPFGTYWADWKTYKVICPEQAKKQYIKDKFPNQKVIIQEDLIKVYCEEAHSFRYSIRCQKGILEKKNFNCKKKFFIKLRNFISKYGNNIITIVAYSIPFTMLITKNVFIGLILAALLIILIPAVLFNTH